MTHVGVVLVRNSRTAMEEANEIIEVLQGVAMAPTVSDFLMIVPLSAFAELLGTVPTSFVLAGQMLLLENPPSIKLLLEIIFFINLPIGIGTALGSLPHYWLAFFGGKPAIEKFKKYTRVSWEDVEKFETKFFKRWYDESAFFLLRVIPLIPTVPLNLFAGILRMKLPTYIILTALGITLRMAIITLIFAYGGGGFLSRLFGL